jgi:hypothetical protein
MDSDDDDDQKPSTCGGKRNTREKFPPQMARWIEAKQEEFKKHRDAGGDESTFKNSAYTAFQKEFGDECKSVPNCKKVRIMFYL